MEQPRDAVIKEGAVDREMELLRWRKSNKGRAR
jgi:hypothetical protein